MMKLFTAEFLYAGIVMYLICLSAAEQSHEVRITRVENAVMDKEWINIQNGQLKKDGKKKGVKVLDGNATIMKDLDRNSVLLEAKFYQKAGGKYMKAPLDIPKKSICTHMRENKVLWPCIQRHTNFPTRCPIHKGEYWMKDMDINDCDFGVNLPPNIPEDYKAEIIFWHGMKQIGYMAGYGKLKKKMVVFNKMPKPF